MDKNQFVKSVSFDSWTLRECDRLARLEGRSRSSLVRQALRFYSATKAAQQGALPGFAQERDREQGRS